MRVELTDKKDVPLDTFDPEYVFDETRENLVNGEPPPQQVTKSSQGLWSKAKSVGGGSGGSSEEVSAGRAETADDIASLIYEEVSFLIKRRYVKTVDPVRFKLAVDDELRPGNELATATPPDWEGALAMWESVEMKKPEFEGDKQYNMAVAHEALAYQAYEATLDPAAAMPWFEKSLALYQRATQLDPDEKWMGRVVERLRLAKENIGRAVDQRNAWEAEREQLRLAFLAEREGQKEMTATRPDTPEEQNFRLMVRAQAEAGATMDEAQLTSLGSTLGLTDISVKRVLHQEAERGKRLGTYEKLLTPLVADGILSAQERAALDAMKPGLRITDEEAAVIEGRHEFARE